MFAMQATRAYHGLNDKKNLKGAKDNVQKPTSGGSLHAHYPKPPSILLCLFH
jgi:hypothetical protein